MTAAEHTTMTVAATPAEVLAGTKIGAGENSGLYRITEKGRVAAKYRDEYDPRDTDAFDELIEREVADK